MKKMLKKLRSQAGESIAETLITVLIIVLAMTILAGMISSTQDMIRKSQTKVNEYYTDSANLETFEGSTGNANLSITMKVGGENTASVPVEYIVNDTFSKYPVIAYRTAAEGTSDSTDSDLP